MNEAQDNEDLNKAHHSIKCPNVVYISGLLEEKFPHAAGELLAVLKKHNVTVRVTKKTPKIYGVVTICRFRIVKVNLFNSTMTLLISKASKNGKNQRVMFMRYVRLMVLIQSFRYKNRWMVMS